MIEINVNLDIFENLRYNGSNINAYTYSKRKIFHYQEKIKTL